jgi:hypothetical protein
MNAIDRRTVIVSTLIIFGIGTGIGFMMGDDFNFDRHSYLGGVSYVIHRGDQLGGSGVDPIAACTEYVDAGMYRIDGYSSATDFLSGCRDAYQNWLITNSTLDSGSAGMAETYLVHIPVHRCG